MLRLISTSVCQAVGLVVFVLSALVTNAAGRVPAQDGDAEAIRKSVEAGKIDTALELMKVSRKDSRYYDYVYVHLSLCHVDAHHDKDGRLGDHDRKLVVAALRRLADGQALWAMDRLGVLAYIEKAHAQYLLGQARQAEETLHRAWSAVTRVQTEYDVRKRKHGPLAPALFRLARIYLARYEETRTGKVPPSVFAGNRRSSCPRAEAVRHYLHKAYNVLVADLQKREIRESSWSKRALREIPGVTALLKQAGWRPRRLPRVLARKVAYEEGMQNYRSGNFAGAAAKLRMSIMDANGKLTEKGDRAIAALTRIVACDYNTGRVISACKTARTFVRFFPSEDRAWSSLRNALVMAAKVGSKVGNERAKLVADAANMFLEEKPEHPFAPTAAWYLAEQRFNAARDSQGDKSFVSNSREAERLYGELARTYPDSCYGKLASCRLAALHQLAGRKSQAAELYRKYAIFGDVPEGPRVDAGYRAAVLFYEIGRYDDALERIAGITGNNSASDVKAGQIRRWALQLKPWCLTAKAKGLQQEAARLQAEAKALTDRRNLHVRALRTKAARVAIPAVATTPLKDVPRPVIKGEPPHDFALTAFMSGIGAKADLAGGLADRRDALVRIVDDRLWILSSGDMVVTLPAVPPRIIVRGERCEWIPTPLACYRDGKLIGVYDFDEFRIRTDPRAEEELQPPPAASNSLRVEAQIRVSWCKARSDLLVDQARALGKHAVLLREEAADELTALVKTAVSLKDPKFGPAALSFLIRLRQEFGQADAVNRMFKTLQSTYPGHPLTAQMTMNILAWQADEGGRIAAGMLEDVKKRIGTLNSSVLFALAFKSFHWNARGDMENAMLPVAVAALNEIMRRAQTDPAMACWRTRAMYYKAHARFILRDYTGTVKLVDALVAGHPRTAYLFDAMLLKGGALRENGNLQSALDTYNHVLAIAPRDKFPKAYWEAYVAGCETLAMFNDGARLATAHYRFGCAHDFIQPTDPTLRPVAEAALFGLAKTSSLLNKPAETVRYKVRYCKRYPNGIYRKQIKNIR